MNRPRTLQKTIRIHRILKVVAKISKFNLDEIFDDVADVLEAITEHILKFDETTGELKGLSTFSEFLENLLEISNLILRDPKYSEKFNNSKDLLTKVIGLLDKVENRKSKLVIIKMLASLGKKLENKITFARNEGFKKLLLLAGDENIRKEIMRTLKFYVEVKIEEDGTAEGDDKEMKIEESQNLNQELEKTEEEGKNLKGKITKFTKDFKDMINMPGLFKSSEKEEIKEMNENASIEEDRDGMEEEDDDPFETDFPPNADALKSYLKEFKSSTEDGGRRSLFEIFEENTQKMKPSDVEKITCNSLFLKRKKKVIDDDDDDDYFLFNKKKPIQRLSDIGARKSENRKMSLKAEEEK